MRVFKISMLMILSFLLIPQIALAIGVEAALGVWNQSPQGDVSYKGQVLSLDDDLKMGDRAGLYGRAKIDMPLTIPNIYLMVTQSKTGGTGTKAGGFTFGDKTFTANSFTSDLSLNEYDLALYYGLPFVKTATLGKLNVDAGLNIKVVDMDVEITQGANRETKNLTVPVPMAYIGAQVKPIKNLSIEAEIRALALGSDHYYDLIGRIKYKIIGPAFMAAGYRYEDLSVDTRNLKINRRVGGPFVEAGVEF